MKGKIMFGQARSLFEKVLCKRQLLSREFFINSRKPRVGHIRIKTIQTCVHEDIVTQRGNKGKVL